MKFRNFLFVLASMLLFFGCPRSKNLPCITDSNKEHRLPASADEWLTKICVGSEYRSIMVGSEKGTVYNSNYPFVNYSRCGYDTYYDKVFNYSTDRVEPNLSLMVNFRGEQMIDKSGNSINLKRNDSVDLSIRFNSYLSNNVYYQCKISFSLIPKIDSTLMVYYWDNSSYWNPIYSVSGNCQYIGSYQALGKTYNQVYKITNPIQSTSSQNPKYYILDKEYGIITLVTNSQVWNYQTLK